MRFAAVQFDIVWEDKPANHAIIEQMIDEASPRIEPGTFVLLPELGDTGFSFNLDGIVDEKSLSWACRFAKSRKVWLQPGFAERGPDNRGRNCAAIIDPEGNLRATYRKVHPFSFGKEIEFFDGGDAIVLEQCSEFVVSPMICYDLRFPELWRLAALGGQSRDRKGARECDETSNAQSLTHERSSDDRAWAGAEVFTIGASWPAARQTAWRALLIARAIENQAYVVAVNRIGSDPNIQYAGGSIIISPTGEVLAEARDESIVLQHDLDVRTLRDWRTTFPALADSHRKLLGTIKVEQPTPHNPTSTSPSVVNRS